MDRRLAVILAADVVGYSALMERDEAGTFERLKAGRKELFEPEIARHHGHIFKLMGDGLLAEFASVVDAVECAVSIQRALSERNEALPTEQQIKVRIGINLGEVIVDGDDRYGEGVNIAARLEQIADAGGICVSDKVAKEVEKKLAFGFEPMGEQRVKNIAEPIQAYRIRLDGQPIRTPAFPRRGKPWLVAAALAVIAFIVAGAAWWFVSPLDKPITPIGASIVVLPFQNLSDDKQQGYLADGITEDLTTELARIPGLFVISREAAFAYRDKRMTSDRIAAELRVQYVVEGSVRRAGDNMRINAQLIEAAQNRHIWAQRYDDAWTNIFVLQNTVVTSIAAALKLRLIEGRHAADIAGGTKNPAAYEVFLQGLEHEYEGRAGDWAKAIELYQQALALDPNFGRATARIAYIYWNANGQNAMQQELGIGNDMILSKFLKYLDEASKHPSPAYYQLLADQLIYKQKSDEAIAAAQAAIGLDPSDPDGYFEMSVAQTFNGKANDGLAALETMMRVDPRGWTPWRRYIAGLAYFALKRYDDAALTLEQLEPASKATAGTFWADYQGRWLLVAVYGQLGRNADAKRVLGELEPFVARTDDRELTGLMAMGPLPFKDYSVLARVLDGLHKAGVPDLPYELDKLGTRLKGAEMAALLFGSENEGRDLVWGEQSSGKILKDGTFYGHVGDWRETGRSWIEGDALCLDFPTQFRRCAAILKNPGGTFERRNEYLFVHQWAKFEFSITKRID